MSKIYILSIIILIIYPLSNWDIVILDNFSSFDICSLTEKVLISLIIIEQFELQILIPYLWITKIFLFINVILLG